MAEDLKYDVVDMAGKKIDSISLNSAIFGAEEHREAVYATVRWQRNKKRAGTHSTLNRDRIEASNKKPFKQKGTGNARQGSSVSPLMRGGAVSHGPTPRNYEFKLPKKVKRNALCSVLSQKVRDGKLVIVDQLSIESGKTKDMVKVLSAVGVGIAPVVMVTSEKVENVLRSSRNLPKAKTLTVAGTNVYDLLHKEFLVLTKDSVKALEERLQ